MKLCGKCGTWDFKPEDRDRCKVCGEKFGPGHVGRDHANPMYDMTIGGCTVPTWRDDR